VAKLTFYFILKRKMAHNGVFGGLVPFIATRLVDATRPAAGAAPADPLAGSWYPIIVAALYFVIGMIYLRRE